MSTLLIKIIVFHGLVDFATRSAIISPDLSILSFLIQHMGKVLVFGALEASAFCSIIRGRSGRFVAYDFGKPGLHKTTGCWLGAGCLCCFRGWFRFCL